MNSTIHVGQPVSEIAFPEANILICDEDSLLAQVVAFKLKERLKCTVTIVEDGKKAMDMIGTRSFDLVITEMFLKYKSGMELIDHIKNRVDREVPILIYSKHLSDDSIEQSLILGAEDFIRKPLDVNDFCMRCLLLLKRHAHAY